MAYREETFDLQFGDILVLMTDGIIEAHAADGRMYDELGRLEQVLTGFTENRLSWLYLLAWISLLATTKRRVSPKTLT